MAYPHLLVQTVNVEIDPIVFQHRPLSTKAPLIACSTKVPELVLPLYHMVRARAESGHNCGSLFQWLFLGKVFQRETLAQTLGDAFTTSHLKRCRGSRSSSLGRNGIGMLTGRLQGRTFGQRCYRTRALSIWRSKRDDTLHRRGNDCLPAQPRTLGFVERTWQTGRPALFPHPARE